MSNALVASNLSLPASAQQAEFVTMRIGGQLFGISVLMVQDVMNPRKITPIPLARPEIAGALNLRGRIVTTLDMRARLALPPKGDKASMCVVVEHKNDLYSLLVDQVGEVLSLPMSGFEPNPANLTPQWQSVSAGVYRLQGELLVVLDVAAILTM